MRIRAATIEDCGELARGASAVAAEGWLATEGDTPVADLEQRFRAAVEWDGHLLLALEDDGRLVGAVGLRPTEALGVLSLGIWVLAGWRGRGAGRMLIEAALEARPESAHKIELEVFPDNAAAINLYRTTGFAQEGLRRDHYRRADGSLRSALVMARLFEARL